MGALTLGLAVVTHIVQVGMSTVPNHTCVIMLKYVMHTAQ